MGIAAEKISDFESAKEFYEKSLSIAQSMSDMNLIAKNYNDLISYFTFK
jgi:uncharacterized protein HemY